jgi:arylsulfatase A-like enzyme
MPLALMWPRGIPNPGRQVDDYVSFIDIAPNCLEIAGVDAAALGMPAMTGKSLSNLFASDLSGRIDSERSFALIGKERHDPGRPHNQGYPIRGIFSEGWLYLRNYQPDRWPAGNPETGYMGCDKSPTKTEVLKSRADPATRHFWRLCFGKRPAEELYHFAEDPDCLHNLASDPAHAERCQRLRQTMETELRSQGDPRMAGHGDIFDSYPFNHPWLQDFYERYQRRHVTGETMEPGWILPSDIEWVDDQGDPVEPRF